MTGEGGSEVTLFKGFISRLAALKILIPSPLRQMTTSKQFLSADIVSHSEGTQPSASPQYSGVCGTNQ